MYSYRYVKLVISKNVFEMLRIFNEKMWLADNSLWTLHCLLFPDILTRGQGINRIILWESTNYQSLYYYGWVLSKKKTVAKANAHRQSYAILSPSPCFEKNAKQKWNASEKGVLSRAKVRESIELKLEQKRGGRMSHGMKTAV